MEQIIKILDFVWSSFIHIWPYLIITIPLAVIVQVLGVSKKINGLFNQKPFISIILTTAIGAISPFCSCGVIPVIASLLISGVPLAPVMSFWIASPSMDPEIFFLSVSVIGWKLSIWRLSATFVISLSSGFITHFAAKRGFFGNQIIRENPVFVIKPLKVIYEKAFSYTKKILLILINGKPSQENLLAITQTKNNINCCVPFQVSFETGKMNQSSSSCSCNNQIAKNPVPLLKKLSTETFKAVIMVLKFMFLAFFLNALIKFYLPTGFFNGILGKDNSFSVLISTLIGIPFYTSNIAALPIIQGLIAAGMNQGAALSFLIAGPVTTLPAMIAVWGIVKARVFAFYLMFSLIGALFAGYLFNLFN